MTSFKVKGDAENVESDADKIIGKDNRVAEQQEHGNKYYMSEKAVQVEDIIRNKVRIAVMFCSPVIINQPQAHPYFSAEIKCSAR